MDQTMILMKCGMILKPGGVFAVAMWVTFMKMIIMVIERAFPVTLDANLVQGGFQVIVYPATGLSLAT